ncbi:hypothetical protein ElyMa_000043200 [Elysia marginata]|uniref:Uncharacterized protein n=1 Tax=Elysia marginata TaxID=1093978 RepID=A0AAV4EEJ5_9GAST|nr:hypothetical protein ElyMa_000043200 [Elysia marginata]
MIQGRKEEQSQEEVLTCCPSPPVPDDEKADLINFPRHLMLLCSDPVWCQATTLLPSHLYCRLVQLAPLWPPACRELSNPR